MSNEVADVLEEAMENDTAIPAAWECVDCDQYNVALATSCIECNTDRTLKPKVNFGGTKRRKQREEQQNAQLSEVDGAVKQIDEKQRQTIVFQHHDMDEDGKLMQHEFEDAFRALGPFEASLDSDGVSQIFNVLDVKRDHLVFLAEFLGMKKTRVFKLYMKPKWKKGKRLAAVAAAMAWASAEGAKAAACMAGELVGPILLASRNAATAALSAAYYTQRVRRYAHQCLGRQLVVTSGITAAELPTANACALFIGSLAGFASARQHKAESDSLQQGHGISKQRPQEQVKGRRRRKDKGAFSPQKVKRKTQAQRTIEQQSKEKVAIKRKEQQLYEPIVHAELISLPALAHRDHRQLTRRQQIERKQNELLVVRHFNQQPPQLPLSATSRQIDLGLRTRVVSGFSLSTPQLPRIHRHVVGMPHLA
jgi:hypothetical protein